MKGTYVCVVGVHVGNTRRVEMMRNNRSQQLSDVRNNMCHKKFSIFTIVLLTLEFGIC